MPELEETRVAENVYQRVARHPLCGTITLYQMPLPLLVSAHGLRANKVAATQHANVSPVVTFALSQLVRLRDDQTQHQLMSELTTIFQKNRSTLANASRSE